MDAPPPEPGPVARHTFPPPAGEDPRAAVVAAETARRDARVREAQADSGLVWHYTDGNGLVSILRNHELWATSSSFLNDQYEVALGLRLVAERVRELAVEDGRSLFVALAERLEEVTVETFADLSPARFFILSASQAWDSLAMWRCYGGVAESYAIGLDASAPLLVLADGEDLLAPEGLLLKRQAWRPVAYRSPDQRRLVDAVYDEMPDQIAAVQRALVGSAPPQDGKPWDFELPAEAQELLDELEQALLLIKHEGFLDERETRYSVVAWESGRPGVDTVLSRLVDYRPSPYGIAPFLRLTGAPEGEDDPASITVTRSRLPVRAVAISPSPNGPVATESVGRLLHTSGYGDLPVLRSAIPFRAG